MSSKRNTLLATAAAVVLLAGTGVAIAQGTTKDQGSSSSIGGATNSATPSSAMRSNEGSAVGQHALSEDKMHSDSKGFGSSDQAQENGMKGTGPANQEGKARQESKSNQSAQEMNRGKGEEHNEASKDRDRGGKKDQDHLRAAQGKEKQGREAAQEQSQRRSTAEEHRTGSSSTAERTEHNGSMKGLQGNASLPMKGGNVQLNDEQRTTIRKEVIDAHGAPRVGHVDFDVRVGTIIHRRDVDIVPVPETLVRVEPEWRGYLYFVYEDEVVIVNPHDMRIVAVVAV